MPGADLSYCLAQIWLSSGRIRKMDVWVVYGEVVGTFIGEHVDE